MTTKLLNSIFGAGFLRSLGYLRPYRARIFAAILCVVFIAALWGSGLGLMLPGSKILLSKEGLHGWAYNTMAESRLDINLVELPDRLTFPDATLAHVLQVTHVEGKGRASHTGLKAKQLLVGLDLPGRGPVHMEPLPLARTIAESSPDQMLRLLVYDLRNETTSTVDVPPGANSAGASRYVKNLGVSMLSYVVQRVPQPERFSDRFTMFAGLLALVLIVTLVRAIFTFIQEYLVGSAIWRGMMDLRCENYNVVLHLPTTFFSEKGISDATSRFLQDTGELARGQNTLLGKTLVEPAKAVGSLIIALAFSWQLTLVAAIAGPPAFWLIHRFGKKMHKASRRALESWSAMLSILSETLIGIRVVKAYTMEGSERRRFFRVNRQLMTQQNKMELLDAATGPSIETLGIFAGMAAAGAAGYLVFKGFMLFGEFYKMDPDMFLTWMVALFALFDPVRKLAKVSMRFQSSDAAAKRIFELQDTPQEKQVAAAPSLPRHAQSLEFRNVSYRYPNAAEDSVKDASFLIRAGEMVAIVGPNGSGKTTLLSLLPRLLEPRAGQILLDGRDIAQYSARSLRRQIGLVTQETVLFHATIAENIAYGLRRPRREDVLYAARKAFVDEFVKDLPAGYDTMVGEHGATLSGGQRQRIAIARTILRDPSILIFDEAMSQVDADSEQRITEAMQEFVKGRTTLLIAHRFATIRSAARIIVMNAGRLIDSGRHEELLARCDLYNHLYRTQFADGAAG